LLGNTDPCLIPEKELHKEAKRCKKCLVFSHADVAMQVQCGGRNRIVRMDILDRDMFDPHARTPEHTSWTMVLLTRLDRAVGPGAMDRPMLNVAEPGQTIPADPNVKPILEDLRLGKFDGLFSGAPDKPSELSRQAQIPPPVPTVELSNGTPVRPIAFSAPKYPPLARLARVSGQVTVAGDVKSDGTVTNIRVISGHPLLVGAARSAASDWKFPAEVAGQEIRIVLQFKTNCPSVGP
jgi:TonB family protein